MNIKPDFICYLFTALLCSLVPYNDSAALEQDQIDSQSDTHPSYVGSDVCISCHQLQGEQWKGSHHDLAMQVATDETVVGDFNNTIFEYHGVVSRFYKKEGRFMVHTDGPDGKMTDYEISYTFGVSPLQQYLIEFSDGRLQALSIAWDSRPKEKGGQRWYHLYPDQAVNAGDDLHWTGGNQNWNFMCASCHSTNIRKNYNQQNNTYLTEWSEINIGCEACHGSGGDHVTWANRTSGWEEFDDSNLGLLIKFQNRPTTIWAIDSNTGNAKGLPHTSSMSEIGVCAPCHSLRSQLSEDNKPGSLVGDAYRVSTLDAHLYYPDGQIKEEVYVYGSFLQSKMYRQGVICRDCHEPHSLQLHDNKERICLGCHDSQKYNTALHHFHLSGSVGSSCIECHMPSKNYMGIDARHDHSFRVPRPDHSVKFDTPNACNNCHNDKSAQWALDSVIDWYGKPPSKGYQNFVEAFYSADNSDYQSEYNLASVFMDSSQSAIARASAIKRLTRNDLYYVVQNLDYLIKDDSSLVRRTILERLSEVNISGDMAALSKLLADPVREVREAAALLFLNNSDLFISKSRSVYFQRALSELESSHLLDADKPETHLRLARLRVMQGRKGDAEDELLQALTIDPGFVPAAVNLVDLYKLSDREEDSEEVLKNIIKLKPKEAVLHHTLGLWYVRQNRIEEGVNSLEHAVELSPKNHQFALVYAVALSTVEGDQKSVDFLERHVRRNGYNREIILSLAKLHFKLKAYDKAKEYADTAINLR